MITVGFVTCFQQDFQVSDLRVLSTLHYDTLRTASFTGLSTDRGKGNITAFRELDIFRLEVETVHEKGTYCAGSESQEHVPGQDSRLGRIARYMCRDRAAD